VAPAPATLDYGNCTVVNFQWVPGHPFEINTGTRAAVYHISDTPNRVSGSGDMLTERQTDRQTHTETCSS